MLSKHRFETYPSILGGTEHIGWQEHVTFLDKQCSVTLHQHGFRYQCDRGSVVMLSGLVCNAEWLGV